MFHTRCDNCARRILETTTILRPKKVVLRLVINALIAIMFVGNISGENVLTLAKNVTTTRDIYNKNDNFRTRSDDYDRIIKFNENLENQLMNSHRKSLFARNSKVFDSEPVSIEFSSSWAVRLPPQLHKAGKGVVREIAHQLGLDVHGNIGHLRGHYLLVHHTFFNHSPHVNQTLNQIRREITEKLRLHPHVEWFEHERVLKRKKRSLEFKDEFFPSQWHLVSWYYVLFINLSRSKFYTSTRFSLTKTHVLN